MRALNVSIEKSVVVVVEGIDDRIVFEFFCQKWNINNIQFVSLNTKADFDSVSAVVRLPGFDETVRTFAILRDADNNFGSAKQSVEDILRRLSLRIKTDFFILPDNRNTGMLETLLMGSISGDASRVGCIDAFIECLHNKSVDIPEHRKDKAKTYAFLSAFDEPGKRIGEATQAGYWNSDNKIFNPLKEFFKKLVE